MVEKREKFLYTFLVLKFIFIVLIMYGSFFKGDAGSLIYHLGNFLCCGNILLGIFNSLILISLIVILTVIGLCLLNKKDKLIILGTNLLDIILIGFNYLICLTVYNSSYNMPLADAMAKFTVIMAGMTICTALLEFCIWIPYMIVSKRRV